MTPKPDGQTSLLPIGALPCVWMTAGLVAYKLCERGLDCDNCPLDRALRGGSDQGCDVAIGTQDSLWEFRLDRKYHRSHLWLQPMDRDRVRCGIDVFAAHLLTRVTSVVFPTVDSRLDRARPACWVTDDGTPIPLQAPVAGAVLGVNAKVKHDPVLICESPYDDGWLLEVRPETDPTQAGDLISAEQMRERTERQLEKLHSEIRRDLQEDEQVGRTLADGGEAVTDLRRILGTPRYHRLIQGFLS